MARAAKPKRQRQGERWTPARRQTETRRVQAVFQVLADSGRDPAEDQAFCHRLRTGYFNAKRQQGYEYHPPSDDVSGLGTWQRIQLPSHAQRERKLKRWAHEHLPPGELSPDVEARVKSYRKIPDEMRELERQGAYGPQRQRRKGRPSAGIPAALLELRALFSRQHGQHPIWEDVATLARWLFPEDLSPDFDGHRARDWAATYRRRRCK